MAGVGHRTFWRFFSSYIKIIKQAFKKQIPGHNHKKTISIRMFSRWHLILKLPKFFYFLFSRINKGNCYSSSTGNIKLNRKGKTNSPFPSCS